MIEFLTEVGKEETLLSFKFKGSITTTRGGDVLTYLHVYVAMLTRRGKCTRIDRTYIAEKFLHIPSILKVFVSLYTHYLQH